MMNYLILLFLIWGFVIRGTLPYAHQSRTQEIPRSSNLLHHEPEYGFQTVYTASAYVPIDHTGPPLRVVPETEKTQYFFVSSNKSETTIPRFPSSSKFQSPNSYHHQKNMYLNENNVIKNQTFRSHHQNRNYQYNKHQSGQYQFFQSPQKHHNSHHQLKHRRLRHRLNAGGDCIKCPPEKIIIAQKGLDGVLIDPPKLFSCNNRAILNTAYYVETLFGSSFKFLLPHGSHSFHGRIKNKNTGKVVQNCILRYKVIVQQCGRYFPQDNNVKVKCDPGYIWGSKCTFTCREGYLSTEKPMICGDSLHWEGEEPECLTQPALYESQSCDFLGIPDNGRFSCEYPNNIDSEDFENELVTPDGTLCRVKCNRNYEIPLEWQIYSTLRCQNGRWNATLPNLCQPKRSYLY